MATTYSVLTLLSAYTGKTLVKSASARELELLFFSSAMPKLYYVLAILKFQSVT